MALESIKNKYKQILQEPQSDDDSDAEWELARSKRQQRKTYTEHNILGQSLSGNKSSMQAQNGSLLKTKEKLAQTLANLNRKDTEISNLSNENVKMVEENKSLQRQVDSLKDSLSEYERQLIDYKVNGNVLEKQIQRLEKKCQQGAIDKDLLLNQVNFYQHEVEVLKVRLNNERKEFQYASNDLNSINKVRSENERLRNDVKRLHYLLEETEKYGKLSSTIQNCHYLGRAQKESAMWFPQDLIAETQHFCRKWQLAGSSDFLYGLTKFIQKQLKRAERDAIGRVKKIEDYRKKEADRKQNQSLCMHGIGCSTSLGKSLMMNNSRFKGSRRLSHHLESKRTTEEFIYDRLEKSLAAHEQVDHKQLCIELFEEFRHGILVLLADPKPRKKKILKLINWVCESAIELLAKEADRENKIKISE